MTNSPGRRRLRQVSPERIAKVVAALGERCRGVQLQTDGSAIILTADGPTPLTADEEGPNPWDEVLHSGAAAALPSTRRSKVS